MTTTTPPTGTKSAPKNVHYSFRSQDTSTLRQHYQTQIRSIDPASRPRIAQYTYIMPEYVTYIEPCPQDVLYLLPPPPVGFVIGFWDGYIIVYDPGTFYIGTVLDLL